MHQCAMIYCIAHWYIVSLRINKPFYIFHKSVDILRVGTVAEGADVAVFVYQDKSAGVVEAAGGAGVFLGYAEVVVGNVVDRVVIAGDQMPFL